MKSSISKMLALIVLAFVVIFISSSRKAKAADKNSFVTEFKDVKHINKLVVMGNVDVYLTQGIKENLKVYDNYYTKNALVQWENGELRITSFDKQKLIVTITVSNLSAIEASGNVNVRSMNELSTIDLDIQLKNNATAQIEAQAVNISSSLQDQSKLELSGESENQHLALSGAAHYEATRFTSPNRSLTISEGAVASINQGGQSTSIKTYSRVPEKENSLHFDLDF